MSAINVAGSTATAVHANFSFYKGEDVVITDTMDPTTAISGWSLQFTLRKNYGDPSPLLTKTIGSGITVTDATNGVFTIALADADTVNLAPGAYVYDIERTNAGNRTVLTIGVLNILPEVY